MEIKKVRYKEQIIEMINSVNKLKVTNKYKLTNEFLEMLKKVENTEKINLKEVAELLKNSLDKIAFVNVSPDEIRKFTLYIKWLFIYLFECFSLENE